MRILVDVNLSPAWVDELIAQGFEAVHWTSVGDPRAPDSLIMAYAREHDQVVFTHDLDFGTLLALTRSLGPSVVQVRTQDVLPQALSKLVVNVLRKQEQALAKGALVTIDAGTSRVRILPVK